MNGERVLEYCMGLEHEQGEGAGSESDGKVAAAVPSGTALQEKRYQPPFSSLVLYIMGRRASGYGITPLRSLIYAEAINLQVLSFQKKLEDAAHEDADPDADGAGPTRLTEDRWLRMSSSEQAKRLGYPVRKAAFKGTLDPMSWQCKLCQEVSSCKDIACIACGAKQEDGAFGGFVLPSTNAESFKKLMECYEAMETCIKAKRTAKRTEKRKKDAQAMLETEESWDCKPCAIRGHTSRMTLVAEE